MELSREQGFCVSHQGQESDFTAYEVSLNFVPGQCMIRILFKKRRILSNCFLCIISTLGKAIQTGIRFAYPAKGGTVSIGQENSMPLQDYYCDTMCIVHVYVMCTKLLIFYLNSGKVLLGLFHVRKNKQSRPGTTYYSLMLHG